MSNKYFRLLMNGFIDIYTQYMHDFFYNDELDDDATLDFLIRTDNGWYRIILRFDGNHVTPTIMNNDAVVAVATFSCDCCNDPDYFTIVSWMDKIIELHTQQKIYQRRKQ